MDIIKLPEIQTDNTTTSSDPTKPTNTSRSISFSYKSSRPLSELNSSTLASDVYMSLMFKAYDDMAKNNSNNNNKQQQQIQPIENTANILSSFAGQSKTDYNNPVRKYSGNISNSIRPYDELWDTKRKYLGSERAWNNKDIMDLIGDNQSVAQKAGYGTVRFVSGVALKFLEGIGYLADMAAYGITDLIDAGVEAAGGDLGTFNFSDFIEKGAGEALTQVEESVKSALPIYKSSTYTHGSVLDKLGTASFWADDFADGAAFAISALIPGIGQASLAGKGAGIGAKIVATLGKTAKGAKVVNALNKVANLKLIGKSVAFETRALERLIDKSVYTLYSTLTESAVEAASVKKEFKEMYRGTTNPATGEIYTEEELNEAAGIASANTFKGNMALLTLSNRLEASLLFGKTKGGFAGIRNLRNEIKSSAWKTIGRNAVTLGKGILMEGGEELAQYGISETQKELQGLEMSTFGQIGKSITKTIKGFGEDDGLIQFITGAILGSGMSLIGDNIQHNKEIKTKTNLYNTINNANNLLIGSSTKGASIFQRNADGTIKTEEKEITIENADGTTTKKRTTVPVMNKDNAFMQGEEVGKILAQQKLFNMAVENNDLNTINELRDTAVMRWAHTIFSAGANDRLAISEFEKLIKEELDLLNDSKPKNETQEEINKHNNYKKENINNIKEFEKHGIDLIQAMFKGYTLAYNPVILAEMSKVQNEGKKVDSKSGKNDTDTKTLSKKEAYAELSGRIYTDHFRLHRIDQNLAILDEELKDTEVELLDDYTNIIDGEEQKIINANYEKLALKEKKAQIELAIKELKAQKQLIVENSNELLNKVKRNELVSYLTDEKVEKMKDAEQTILKAAIEKDFISKSEKYKTRIDKAELNNDYDELINIRDEIQESEEFKNNEYSDTKSTVISNALKSEFIGNINNKINKIRLKTYNEHLKQINKINSIKELDDYLLKLGEETAKSLLSLIEYRKTKIKEITDKEHFDKYNKLYINETLVNFTVNDEEFIGNIIQVDENNLLINILYDKTGKLTNPITIDIARSELLASKITPMLYIKNDEEVELTKKDIIFADEAINEYLNNKIKTKTKNEKQNNSLNRIKNNKIKKLLRAKYKIENKINKIKLKNTDLTEADKELIIALEQEILELELKIFNIENGLEIKQEEDAESQVEEEKDKVDDKVDDKVEEELKVGDEELVDKQDELEEIKDETEDKEIDKYNKLIKNETLINFIDLTNSDNRNKEFIGYLMGVNTDFAVLKVLYDDTGKLDPNKQYSIAITAFELKSLYGEYKFIPMFYIKNGKEIELTKKDITFADAAIVEHLKNKIKTKIEYEKQLNSLNKAKNFRVHIISQNIYKIERKIKNIRLKTNLTEVEKEQIIALNLKILKIEHRIINVKNSYKKRINILDKNINGKINLEIKQEETDKLDEIKNKLQTLIKLEKSYKDKLEEINNTIKKYNEQLRLIALSNNPIYDNRLQQINDILLQLTKERDNLKHVISRIVEYGEPVEYSFSEIQELEDIDIVNISDINTSKTDDAYGHIVEGDTINININDNSLDALVGDEVDVIVTFNEDTTNIESLDMDKYSIDVVDKKTNKIIGNLATTQYLKHELALFEPLAKVDKNDDNLKKLLQLTAMGKLIIDKNGLSEIFNDFVQKNLNSVHYLIKTLTGYDYWKELEIMKQRNPSNTYTYDYLTDSKMFLHLIKILMYEQAVTSKTQLNILAENNNDLEYKDTLDIIYDKLIENIERWNDKIRNDLGTTVSIQNKLKEKLKNNKDVKTKTTKIKLDAAVIKTTKATPIESTTPQKINNIIEQGKGKVAVVKNDELVDLDGNVIKTAKKSAPMYLVLDYNGEPYPTTLDTAKLNIEDKSKLEKYIIALLQSQDTTIFDKIKDITYGKLYHPQETKLRRVIYLYKHSGITSLHISDGIKLREITITENGLALDNSVDLFNSWINNTRYNVPIKTMTNEYVKENLHRFETHLEPIMEGDKIKQLFSIKGRRNATVSIKITEGTQIEKELSFEEMLNTVYKNEIDKKEKLLNVYNNSDERSKLKLIDKLKKDYNEFKCK